MARHGTKIRPIERKDIWSDDKLASALFSVSQLGKFSAGPNATAQKRFGSVAAGRRIGRSLGGADYTPVTAPKSTNIGSS